MSQSWLSEAQFLIVTQQIFLATTSLILDLILRITESWINKSLLRGLEGSKQQQQSSTVRPDRFSESDTMPNRGQTFILLGK